MIGMTDRGMSGTLLMDRLDEVFSICGEDILDRLGTGHITPAAYDTGFVARISDEEGNPEFPQTLDWLVANQRDDGSWGSDVHHEYDRFINTLSASIALKERRHSPEAVAMAEAYLSEAIHRLEGAEEGVASDHVIAMLMDEAKRVGLDVPHEANPHKGVNVLQKAIRSLLYVDPDHPLAFYSEILGRVPSQKRITKKLMMENGSISSSPASTAASIIWDPFPERDHAYYDKIRFLVDCMNPDGGISHFRHHDTMERVYGLYNLIHVKSLEREYRKSAMVLKDQWREDGLSFGQHFNVPDLDNTAMGYVILTKMGHEPDPFVFDKYWRRDFFVTYRVHDKGHPCPNIHALEALALSSHPFKDGLIDKTIRFLRSQMIDGNHFQDYWHLSPAYPTCHAIFAFHLTEETLMESCVDFFLDTQRDDGSWGFTSNGNGLGTLEETAFALQGLLYYHQHVESIDLEPVNRGIEFILDGFPSARYPEMWWAKVLNTSENIVESGVIGALLMFRQAGPSTTAREIRAPSGGGGIIDGE
jgi:hypothetical protein